MSKNRSLCCFHSSVFCPGCFSSCLAAACCPGLERSSLELGSFAWPCPGWLSSSSPFSWPAPKVKGKNKNRANGKEHTHGMVHLFCRQQKQFHNYAPLETSRQNHIFTFFLCFS
ncbi:hypothetical protein EGW08_016030 [Elysia chlorotica]|uniref:Secreted protein n=1 Tax=Elysia chlorotica TaxID=188477 RepID=A0A3S1B6M3_ELYCH|nr:hypothetical protein EGW08_016030 [Elysia chlorotica]